MNRETFERQWINNYSMLPPFDIMDLAERNKFKEVIYNIIDNIDLLYNTDENKCPDCNCDNGNNCTL